MQLTRAGFFGLPPIVQAALMMTGGAACVALQNSMIRIVSAEIHTFEIVFFRNLFGLVALLPAMGGGVGLTLMRTTRPGGLLAMSSAHLAGMVCYFMAIAYLPLAEVIALGFSKPLFVTLGAALVLREVVRARRWTAVLVGFAGVMIVLRPGAAAISPYALLILGGTVLGAAVTLMIKRLTATERIATIVWYQALISTVFALPLCLLHWRMPDAMGWLMLIAIGALGTLSWLAMTRSIFLVDASAVVPFEFLRLPFAAVAAYLLFAEVPSVATWIGGVLIFATTIYIAQREAQIARQRAAAQVAAAPSGPSAAA
jgi:drug/metabolite transporter (DMT)-like permease